jgi:hypothetical protein
MKRLLFHSENMDMNQPLFPAPPGYIVDVANPQRDGEVANLILAALFLSIRLYTKIVLARNFSADDGKFSTAKQIKIQPDMTQEHSSWLG